MRRLVATLSLAGLTISPLPVIVTGAGVSAAVVVSGCEDNRAKKTTSKRYDPKLPAGRRICLVTEHIDTNEGDDDNWVTPGREGRWQTSGRAGGACVVQVRDKGKTADGKTPPWRTVARGSNATFYLVADKHSRFRAHNCGPRNYSPTAGYGVIKVECRTNQEWGAKGKSCREHRNCT